MRAWPKHPVIYEINAWVWLAEMGRKHGRLVDLAPWQCPLFRLESP